MKYLALDISTNYTGVVLMSNYKGGNVIWTRTISPKKKWDINRRCDYILDELHHEIDLRWDSQTQVIIEDVYAGRNAKTTVKLALLHGRIYQLLYQNSPYEFWENVFPIHNKEAKKLTGIPKPSKQDVIDYVKTVVNHPDLIMDEHQADATLCVLKHLKDLKDAKKTKV